RKSPAHLPRPEDADRDSHKRLPARGVRFDHVRGNHPVARGHVHRADPSRGRRAIAGGLMPGGNYAVEMTGLVKRFGDFVAVDNVTMHVPHGQIFGFLRPNGAGKSTTIRILCGLLSPTAGTARVAGYSV